MSRRSSLLRHDPQFKSWCIVGTHHPTHHKLLKVKPKKLLNIPQVKTRNVPIIKRFSGGGTFVVDRDSLWTTFIGRDKHLPHVDPYPRDIMKWTADELFGPTFH